MGEAITLLADNSCRLDEATARLIVEQNSMISALQQRVGFLEEEFNRLERRIERLDPPPYAPRAEVINLTSDEDSEDDDVIVVEPVQEEVRKWACDFV